MVSLALEDLHLAVSLLNPDVTSKVAHWYLDVWMQFAFNLVEKVKVLVSFTCGVHGLGSMKDRYRHRLDSEGVQGQLRQRRDPLVHGAGGEGSIVRRAIMSDESLPVFMDMVPGQLTRWIFRPGPRLPAPIRYRWELTGTGSSNSDIVVEGDKASMGPAGKGKADVTFHCDTETFVLIAFGRLTTDTPTAGERLTMQGDNRLALEFQRWFRGM